MKIQQWIRVQGMKPLMAKLKRLKGGRQRAILRSAVTSASRVVAKTARQLAPRDTGALRKSIGQKVVTYKRTNAVIGIIGPRTGHAKTIDGRKRDPIYYAHLIEGGHRAVAGGTAKRENGYSAAPSRAGKDFTGKGIVVSHVPARPFLRPALIRNQSKISQIMRTKISEGLRREAMRGKR